MAKPSGKAASRKELEGDSSLDARSLRFAYADPPYPGQAKRHYAAHPDYAGEVDHAELIADLERDFPDGWALSTSVAALADVLALCPKGEPSKKRAFGGSIKLGTGVRVCAWIRTGVPFPPSRVMWSWEPLIVRTPYWRQRHRSDFVADTLIATQPRGFLGNSITGQKPEAFSRWVFELLGAGPDDEFVDLFPGSGAVTGHWEAWRMQLTLANTAEWNGADNPELSVLPLPQQGERSR